MVNKMIKDKDISGFFSSNYGDDKYIKSFKELSNGSAGFLVESSDKGYDFDKISKEILGGDILRSVDAIKIINKKIYFIEFKSGFFKKINKNSFDQSQWKCSQTETYCDEGLSYFLQYQKSTVKENKLSIFLKLLESYLTFEKIIIPNCKDSNCVFEVIYLSVIDAVKYLPNDAIESILNDMCNISSDKNSIQSFQSSLNKYVIKDSNGNVLLYDKVKVLLKEEFDELFC